MEETGLRFLVIRSVFGCFNVGVMVRSRDEQYWFAFAKRQHIALVCEQERVDQEALEGSLYRLAERMADPLFCEALPTEITKHFQGVFEVTPWIDFSKKMEPGELLGLAYLDQIKAPLTGPIVAVEAKPNEYTQERAFRRMDTQLIHHTARFRALGLEGLELEQILEMDESKALELICRLRWPRTGGRATCPFCEETETYLDDRNRRVWVCKTCKKRFKVFSLTPFSGRKLSYRQVLYLLLAIKGGGPGVVLGSVFSGYDRRSLDEVILTIREHIGPDLVIPTLPSFKRGKGGRLVSPLIAQRASYRRELESILGGDCQNKAHIELARRICRYILYDGVRTQKRKTVEEDFPDSPDRAWWFYTLLLDQTLSYLASFINKTQSQTCYG